MKIARFVYNGQEHFGEVEGDEQRVTLLEGELYGQLRRTEQQVELSAVQLLAPLAVNQFLCIGLNYMDHIKEKNRHIPEEPMVFMVSNTSLAATDCEVSLPYSDHLVEHEAELAVIIKKEGKNISREAAKEYILGYTCCNDVSDRVLQDKDRQFTRAKSFDNFKPLGPWISTDIDPLSVNIELRVNGEVRQTSNTSQMVFDTYQLVETISHFMTLKPGDVIITGTPGGVGPMKNGDRLEVEIEGIGTLRHSVKS